MARFRGGKSVNRNPHVPLALVRRKKDVVDFSEVRFVVALRINTAGSERTLSWHCLWGLSKVEADKRDVCWEGLWRCLAFFTFPRCDLWVLWFMVYGGALHSLQLRSKRCIQFIVRPHPRLALKSPNIRMEWPFYAKQRIR